MNNFNLNLFKYYYVVYYQGFTNASKELNIAQSSLSYNVKKLEEQLNMQLIIRGRKQFELTDDGHNLYEIIKTVFSSLERNIAQFHDDNTIYSELTIGVRHSIFHPIL